MRRSAILSGCSRTLPPEPVGKRTSQAGGLLTREERYMMRVLARDLTARADRAADPGERDRLLRAVEAIRREQQFDKLTRPKGGR